MMMDCNLWTYQGTPYLGIEGSPYGFTYCITYTDGKKYIGKKLFYSKTIKPVNPTGVLPKTFVRQVYKIIFRDSNGKIITSKKGRKVARSHGNNGSREYYNQCIKESNWKAYNGSSKLTASLTIKSKEILQFAKTSKELFYLEDSMLIMTNAIFSPMYLNQAVGNRYFYKPSSK